MNKIILVALLLPWTSGIIEAQPTPSKNEQGVDTLKVLTYNIWNGFDWGKDTQRRDNTHQWIDSKTPDIVALQELCGYTPEKLAKEAKKWGHSYSVLLKNKGYSVGLTSNRPIELKEKVFDNLWHGMLHCKTWDIDFFCSSFESGRQRF